MCSLITQKKKENTQTRQNYYFLFIMKILILNNFGLTFQVVF